MIQDVDVKVTFTVHGKPDEIVLTMTGQQISDTMKRRMQSLMPTARITDITEVPKTTAQTDLIGNAETPRKQR